MNPVLAVLEQLIENAPHTNISYHGKMYRLDAEDLPVKAGVQLVNRELKALTEKAEGETE